MHGSAVLGFCRPIFMEILDLPKRNGKYLTPKMRRFINEYLKDLNASAAGQRAGYPHKNSGKRVLHHPLVKAELEKRWLKQAKSADVSVERILAEYEKLAFSNLLNFVNVDPQTGFPRVDLRELPEEYAAAISGVDIDRDGKIKVKLHDKRSALQDLGRYHAMFTDKVEVVDGLAERLDAARKRKRK